MRLRNFSPLQFPAFALALSVAAGSACGGSTSSGPPADGSQTGAVGGALDGGDGSVASDGGGPSGTGCLADTDCTAKEYCRHSDGACAAAGVCQASFALPCLPPSGDEAVCGCDGKTYNSNCEVVPVTSVAHAGACGTGTASDAGSDSGTTTTPAKVMCGGFAGIKCPGAGQCVDDPSDSCDPAHGGADCGGMCTCDAKAKCAAGLSFDSSPAVCACTAAACLTDPCMTVRCTASTTCVADATCHASCVPNASDAGAGPSCGTKSCAAGQVCCNASCGVCVPPGGACTQVACR